MMKILVFAFLLALSFAHFTNPVFAQSPEKILKKAAKALGGEKNLRNVSARQATGRITRLGDGASGAYQNNAANPGLYAETFDLNGIETANGYNGKSSWAKDAANNLQTLTGATSRDFQVFARYRNGLWLNFNKARAFYDRQTEINGKKVDSLTLVIAKNQRIKLYIDAVSGLPLREEFQIGDRRRVYDYADYRIVNGINEPFAIKMSDGELDYQIKLDRVVHNQPLAAAVFDFPVVSTEPLPAVSDLLKQVEANEDKVDEILENYTYTETQASREVGDDGVVREKEIEKRQVTFYKGFQIRRLIARNGKPLSESESKSEERKAAEAIADIENKVVKRDRRAAAATTENAVAEQQHSARDQIGTSGDRISIGELLRASVFKNPRRERFRNRDVIVFDYEPNPNFDFSRAKSLLKFFGKTTGAIWIDEQDKQVARVEAVLADNFNVAGGVLAKLKKGASFTLEQNRVNDEIWLPTSADINLSIKVLLVKGININQLVRYTDYQKFKSEVKDAKVGAPQS